MNTVASLSPRTPVLVGAGQVVRREADEASPMMLAAAAARAALEHSGGSGVAEAIDTVSVTRLFSESMGYQDCGFGRSDNPPMSVAAAIGASPRNCIYGQVGGNEPQSRIIEFARDIARGERSLVLLAGAEASYNQRVAEQDGRQLDWGEHFEQALDDRGWGEMFVTNQEVANGMLAPIFYYAMIEQARAAAAGCHYEQHREATATIMSQLNAVAVANPFAQFPQAMSASDIGQATLLNHLYSKSMIARDTVNLGAALLLCSVAEARRLGIPEGNWVYLHGLAEGEDVNLSEREDPGRSQMMARVYRHALAQAGVAADELDLVDIYSCFPCAFTAGAEILGRPLDDPAALTLTGGLPFFGGPGNNYTMHSLAEAVTRLRNEPSALALVTGVGGVLSKHAAGIYSGRPSTLDWAEVETRVDSAGLVRRRLDEKPEAGKILSYVVNYHRGQASQAMVLAETALKRRFVAVSAHGDTFTVGSMLASSRIGARIRVSSAPGGVLHFRLQV